MNLGTKTLLFGVHQIAIHPFLVVVAWVKIYNSFPSWRELICIFIHDWGYWGKPSLKCADGDKHPELGGKIAGWLFDEKWRDFVLGHSSFYVKRNGISKSKLFYPDKYWHCLIPLWFYKILAVPTGEFKHYRELKHARQVSELNATDQEWWLKLQQICLDKINHKFEIDENKLDQG
jgi:hypothetical protein